MMKRLHVFFSGNVQGVGFRFTCRDIAERFKNISGWVKNLSDGKVELVAEGEQKELMGFFKKVDEYFERYISSREVRWEKATGEFTRFEIER